MAMEVWNFNNNYKICDLMTTAKPHSVNDTTIKIGFFAGIGIEKWVAFDRAVGNRRLYATEENLNAV